MFKSMCNRFFGWIMVYVSTRQRATERPHTSCTFMAVRWSELGLTPACSVLINDVIEKENEGDRETSAFYTSLSSAGGYVPPQNCNPF